MLFKGFVRLSDGLEERFAADAFTSMADKTGGSPAGGLEALSLAYPTQFFLDPPSGGGELVGGQLLANQSPWWRNTQPKGDQTLGTSINSTWNVEEPSNLIETPQSNCKIR